MRELKYYIACTVDSFIAEVDGSFDSFLMEGPHLADLFATFSDTVPGHLRNALGVHDENRRFDTVLMGRRTYEVGLAIGVTSPYPHLRQYVFSRTIEESPSPDVTLVSGDPLTSVRRLKREEGKDIWLCGGGTLATAVFPEIDEMILKINPILLGAGIPLFEGVVPKTDLTLTESKVYENGFILARYRMRR
jgi:dihydrofolate reductase